MKIVIKLISLLTIFFLSNGMNKTDNVNVDKESTSTGKSTFTRDIAIGSIVGAAEVTINQPLVYFKNRLQQGEAIYDVKLPFKCNVAKWYRGYMVNVSSMAPITALQVAMKGTYLQLLLTQYNMMPYDKANLYAACAAGATSALVTTPSELVMLHQQKTGKSAGWTISNLAQYGDSTLFRGIVATALRDSGFTAGYLVANPMLKRFFMTKTDNASLATTGAMLTSGICTALATHPFDTIKTHMQAQYDKSSIVSVKSYFKGQTPTGLIKKSYAGCGPRVLRVTLALGLMSESTERLTKLADKM